MAKALRVFRGVENLDGEWPQYMIELTKDKPVFIKDYSKFFLALLDNKENNIAKKNPFSSNEEPFYGLYESYLNKRVRYMKYFN